MQVQGGMWVGSRLALYAGALHSRQAAVPSHPAVGAAAASARHPHFQSAFTFSAAAAVPAQVVGLILLSALQRRRRGIHISTMLRPEQAPAGTTVAELRAARGTSLDLTSQLEVIV